MNHYIDISNAHAEKIWNLSEKFRGKDPQGHEIGFNNYYMILDNKPFFGVSGEIHYARVAEEQWEDSILKMKMCGINVVATYCFWIHHEEIEGKFRFDGNRNFRKFIELCAKHGLFVIIRIGPFDHGECRNGGFPDWLYGKPFEARTTDPCFLFYVRRLYRKISEQLRGLFYKDGGPVIGAQLDNEYMHSAAPWEMTSGLTNEWCTCGYEGNTYMLALKKIAQEEGIIPVFYTCTGWGGAATPVEDMLPLHGGYAYWPWIYYDYSGPHPVTPEYIYRYYHNNAVPKTYNFEPSYEPESVPYACCEMGGGGGNAYKYRMVTDYMNVDAMANIKMAGGCNFLGYYMFGGGNQPKGERQTFLNEGQCPKISYDGDCPLGVDGQLRPSYYRIKAVHNFAESFQEELCKMTSVLPEEAEKIEPSDTVKLRYAIRTDGKKGYLFLNNYQDHAKLHEKKDENITLKLADAEITFNNLSLGAGEETILPFHMDMDGYCLITATLQPLSVLNVNGKRTYIFFIPAGMNPEYVLDGKDIEEVDGRTVNEKTIKIVPVKDKASITEIGGRNGQICIMTLTRRQSLEFYKLTFNGIDYAVLSDSPLIFTNDRLYVENPTWPQEIKQKTEENAKTASLKFYPSLTIRTSSDVDVMEEKDKTFSCYKIQFKGVGQYPLHAEECARYRYKFMAPKVPDGYKNLLLRIRYTGDVGMAFFDGELVSDNYCNETAWEIGLRDVHRPGGDEMTILISPVKHSDIDVSSTMAGRLEILKNASGSLDEISVQPVKEAVLTLHPVSDIS